MSGVEFRNLSKTYDAGAPALVDLDLSVGDGEFMVLVGPSGCGKSTTLRLLAGLEQPSAGEIRIGGQCVNALPPQQRNIAMVFQNYALYPHMDVRSNLAFPLRMQKLSRTEIEHRVGEAAAMLELTDLLRRKPRELSGGQRQRVAMGRAIVRRPSVFLMDEPLSNLDARLRVQIRADIAELQRRLGVTTIYVTHDQVEAMTLGQRVAVLKDGRLQQAAEPGELYQRPANTFVAGFIGSPGMNLVAAVLEPAASGFAVRWRDSLIPLQGGEPVPGRKLEAFAGSPITLGLRPDALGVGEEHPEHTQFMVRAVEALGHEQLVYLGSGAAAEASLVMRVEGGSRVAVGDRVSVRVDPRRLYLFDAAGAAIHWGADR